MSDPASEARELMKTKEAIEAELQTHIAVLKTQGVAMDTPLVDREGFPRADVDIYAVRGARKRIIELRNDLKAAINDIATALEAVFDRTQEMSVDVQEAAAAPVPFAKVDGVAPGGPASDAGLQREDLVVKFGGLTRQSFAAGSLQPLVQLVANRENQSISITVMRSGEEKVLSMTPRKGWGGRGLIGCHIVPYAS